MGTGRFVMVAMLSCLVLRFPSLLWPLGPDESGYVLVAGRWGSSPEDLYGFYFVDRPPLLLGLYALAEDLAAPYLPRLVAAAAACASAGVAGRIGWLLGGARAGRWSAVAAVALVCTPMLGSYQAKGEILALPLVLAGCWLSLEALRAPALSHGWGLALGAGASGALALGMKQNLYGGLVFAGLLLIGAVVARRVPRREAVVLATGVVAGAAVGVAALLGWVAARGVELETLWEALYGFRLDAFTAISSASMRAVTDRLALLAGYFVLTGIGIVLTVFLVRIRGAWAAHPHVTVAVTGMVVADLVPVALGGAYWSSYLVPVVAGALIAVALLSGRPARLAALVCVVSSAVSLAVFTTLVLSGASAPTRRYVGEAIGAASRPGDTVVTVYGAGDLVQASGLEAPYPYLWSLPTRVLDPDLRRLRALLASTERPTWVAVVLPPNSWRLDDRRLLRGLLDLHYRQVGVHCGVRVLLRSDLRRPPLSAVDCDRPYRLTALGTGSPDPTGKVAPA